MCGLCRVFRKQKHMSRKIKQTAGSWHRNPGAKIYYATTKGRHVYSDVSYEPDCYIMFGKESAGIPEEILKENPDTCVRIPMMGETRSLNLSNSVAIVLYEALRQNKFDHMKLEGQLHRLSWDE